MKVKFYVATLAAAVERANRIAPNKGVAYDKASGILLEVDPNDGTACLKSTDLQVYYREEIKDVVEYGSEAISWRFPSRLFAGIMASLPLDKEVTFTKQDERTVLLSCGRKRAKLKTMAPDLFPEFDRIPRDQLKEIPGFVHRVNQIAWCTDKESVPYTGINIDGENLNATDRYRLARVPCEVPIDKRVTVPLATLAPILKNLPSEVSLAATENSLLVAAGGEIEATCVIFEQSYPDLNRALRTDFTFEARLHRETLRDAIQSMLVLVENERYPRMTFDFEEGAVALFMSVPETGDMTDTVEATFPDGETFSITFTPEFLLRALDAGSGDFVTWSMGPEKTQMTRIKDGDYVSYIMPLADIAEKK